MQINANGYIQYDVITSLSNNNPISDQIQNMDPLSPVNHFADGLWHTFYMRLSKNMAQVTIDNYVRITNQVCFNRCTTYSFTPLFRTARINYGVFERLTEFVRRHSTSRRRRHITWAAIGQAIPLSWVACATSSLAAT